MRNPKLNFVCNFNDNLTMKDCVALAEQYGYKNKEAGGGFRRSIVIFLNDVDSSKQYILQNCKFIPKEHTDFTFINDIETLKNTLEKVKGYSIMASLNLI